MLNGVIGKNMEGGLNIEKILRVEIGGRVGNGGIREKMESTNKTRGAQGMLWRGKEACVLDNLGSVGSEFGRETVGTRCKGF